jgi:hypothetical protein
MRPTALLMTALLLSACSDGTRPLHDTRSSGGGPDDFSVLPVGPLTIPDTLALPEPTPGGTNRTDPNPVGTAVAVLGGQQGTGSAANDAALIAQATRNGVDPGVRSALATEDAAFRRRQSVLGVFSFFSRDRYFKAYSGQALDAYAELSRFRNLGVATPSAPPAP